MASGAFNLGSGVHSSRDLSARFGFERELKAFVKVGGGLSGVMREVKASWQPRRPVSESVRHGAQRQLATVAVNF
jgi:hypothetical protein